jgi:hypothetical protein
MSLVLKLRMIAYAFAVASLVGCTASQTAPDADNAIVMPPPSPTTPTSLDTQPLQAWMDRSLGLTSYDAVQLAEMAEAPMILLSLRLVLSDEGETAIRAIRAFNPDVLIVGILPTLSVNTSYDSEDQRTRFPMGAELHDLLLPHVARTTTGDTPLMWSSAPMVNPYRAGGFKTGLLADVLDIVSTYAALHPGVLDGVFHDYLSQAPFLFPGQTNVGEVDLDGDGIGASDDPNDRDAWLSWQRALVAGFQQRFGEGLIQIGNGRLPHSDPVTASLLAGIAYENFPTTVWAYSDQEGLELALEHLSPGYLTPRRGRLYSLMWDRRGQSLEFCRSAAALSDQFFVKRDAVPWVGLENSNGSLGTALGPLTRSVDSSLNIRFERRFESGQAIIQTNASGAATSSQIVPD